MAQKQSLTFHTSRMEKMMEIAVHIIGTGKGLARFTWACANWFHFPITPTRVNNEAKSARTKVWDNGWLDVNFLRGSPKASEEVERQRTLSLLSSFPWFCCLTAIMSSNTDSNTCYGYIDPYIAFGVALFMLAIERKRWVLGQRLPGNSVQTSNKALLSKLIHK